MSFTIRNKTGGAIALNDLGLTIDASADLSLLTESAQDVQDSGQSGGDLNTEISAGNIVVLDPKDGSTELSIADSITVVQIHNDPNWGVNGVGLTDLDDVDLTGVVQNDILQYNGSPLGWNPITVSTLSSSINLGDLGDVTDAGGSPYHATGEFYILEGDGTNLVVTEGSTDTTVFIPWIEDTAGAMVAGGSQTDIILTYNAGTNQIDASIDDSYLRNNGDTLDSGTLTIASGATLSVISGATLTIASGATGTIIDAPVSNTDIANKAYVDSVAAGLDTKDSVHAATTPLSGSPETGGNITGYSTVGSPLVGQFTGVNVFLIDNETSTPIVGTRFLIKDQTDAKQNGIFEVSVVGGSPEGTSCTLIRSTDFDGTPANEVSAGAFTFVEHGDVNAGSGWVVTGAGILTLDTDDINWSQFSGGATYSAAEGIDLTGTVFSLDINTLTGTATVVGADEIAFNDVTDSTTKSRTFTSLISDLGLYTSGNLTASDGVTIIGSDIQLDIVSLTPSTTPSLSAEIAFNVGGSPAVHNKTTISSIFTNLDVPYGISTDGILVRTAADTYAQRTLTASATASEEGILITNGDGVAGNPTIGIDIEGTTASVSDFGATDEVLVFDGTNNLAYTGQQIADGVSTMLGGLANAFTTIIGDTGSAIADSSTDSLSLINAINGGIVTTAGSAGSPLEDQVTFALDLDNLSVGGGTVDLTDELAVSEGAASTVKYTFQDVVDDLGIVSGMSAQTGILVSDGAGAYVATQVVASGLGNQDGLVVTNGDGATGSPIGQDILVGLDITGTAAAGEDLAAGDEVIAYNTSATANEKFTGQEVADGVATMLGFGGIAVTTINGQEVLTLVDTTRSNKILSVGDTSVTWSENKIGNNDWMQIGGAVDAQSGYIVPLNATIVKVTAHTSDNKGNTKAIQLYIDASLNGTIGTFVGSGSPTAGEDEFSNVTLNVDIAQGEKLRLRGGSTGGNIEDTVVTVWLKWRG